MCGIVGYISLKDDQYTLEKNHFMHFGLTLDTLRGFDSTGIINVDQRFRVKNQRSLMAGDKYVHSKHYRKNLFDSWAKIGHNRAATKGSIKLQNAHPFTFGDVSLVHNGTLAHKGSSMVTFDSALEVDSMQIALGLSKQPPEKAKEVLESIDGSFAVVWVDRRDESINMARNSDRPLHFTISPAKDIMWFMSDGMHLKTVNKSLWKRPCEGRSIFEMDKWKILKYKKGSLVPEVTSFDPFVRKSLPIVSIMTKRQQERRAKGAGSDQSALQRAVNKWLPRAEEHGDSTVRRGTGDGLKATDMRITVNLKHRKLLIKHLVELRREYDLRPTDLLEFQPVVKYEQQNGRYTVFGDIVHRDWGDSEWDAVLYDVRPAMANAYMGQSWMVNPVGLSRPHAMPREKGATTVPSVLCDLINCDWEQHKPDEEAQDEGKGRVTVNVGDKEIEVTVLDTMLERGCISCTASMNMDDTAYALIVNEGKDLLCGGCVSTLDGWEGNKPYPKEKLN